MQPKNQPYATPYKSCVISMRANLLESSVFPKGIGEEQKSRKASLRLVAKELCKSRDVHGSCWCRLPFAPGKPRLDLKPDIEAIFTDENAVSQENAPGAARTRNLRLRRPSLYPVELRARMNHEHNAI